MGIYIDRSLVEGFFNDCKAISLFAEGDVTIESLYVAVMGSIYN